MDANLDNRKAETRRSNEAKLASLYSEYYDKIARYVYVRIGNKTEAEDLAGEVFLRALKSLRAYKERGIPMQAWLFKIAHNLVVDHFRKLTKRKMIPIDTVEIESGANPEKAAEKKIEIEKLTQAMKQLTTDQQEVLRLRFFGELTSREAGVILDKSDGAVREMQRAAIEKLRQLMARDYKYSG